MARAPLLSVFGGKITTFRKLAEHVLEKLAPFYPTMGPAWTATGKLPGGDFPQAETAERIADFAKRHAVSLAGQCHIACSAPMARSQTR